MTNLADDSMDLQLGKAPAEAHALAEAEGQRRERVVRLRRRTLHPALGAELGRIREVLLAVAHDVVLEYHLGLQTKL